MPYPSHIKTCEELSREAENFLDETDLILKGIERSRISDAKIHESCLTVLYQTKHIDRG